MRGCVCVRRARDGSVMEQSKQRAARERGRAARPRERQRSCQGAPGKRGEAGVRGLDARRRGSARDRVELGQWRRGRGGAADAEGVARGPLGPLEQRTWRRR